MRIESNLCHVSENRVVVQVIAWLNDKNLGSALAEGATVEIAEDKAISRLNKRINLITTKESPIKEDSLKKQINYELPKRGPIDTNNINNEPSDWTNELTAIDLEIERLKWSRDEEINFLEKTFGYNNRNKITNYKDIVNYLNLLKKTDIKQKTEGYKININNLIKESDIILGDLSWDHSQGREYLQKEFNVSTRKELNEEQLISFVEKLKSIKNQFLHF